VPITEHIDYYSEFRICDENTLIVGMSGSGIIPINAARKVPISWQSGLFTKMGCSFLTLTAKCFHFWPERIVDDLQLQFGDEISRFEKVFMVGYSMGGWGVIAHSDRFNAKRILSLSPRAPTERSSYDKARFGDVAPLIWPLRGDVTVISDLQDTGEAQEFELLREYGVVAHLNVPGIGHNAVNLLGNHNTGIAILRGWMDGNLDAPGFAEIIGND
jgi:hypothetical protein